MRPRRRLWLLAGLLGVQGCAAGAPPEGPGEPLAGEVLYNDSYCGEAFSQPAAVWIGSAQGLRQVYGRLSEQRIPAIAPPAVDFSRYGVLLIAMGQRSTGGYGLGFEQGSLQIDGDTLAVTVDWQEPVPGYLHTQALTQPCLLLKVPALAFARIRVLDQNGRVRLSGSRHPSP